MKKVKVNRLKEKWFLILTFLLVGELVEPSLFTLGAAAQSNVQQMFSQLKDMGVEVHYNMSHCWSTTEISITSNIEKNQQNNDIMATIRSAMNEISHTAYKSYFYENHKDGKDTIDYAIMINDNPENRTRAYQGFTQWQSPEILTCTQGRFGDTYLYLHYYKRVTDTQSVDEPFDTKAFRKIIKPILKGQQRRKILISHDREWSSKEENQNKVRRMTTLSGEDLSGTIKGYVYHIKGNEGKEILHQLYQAIHDYINQHQDQCYQFSYYDSNPMLPHHSRSAVPFTLYGMGHATDLSKKSIFIDTGSYHSGNDTYILVADSYGCVWLPMKWHELSSEINGVQTPNRKLQ